MIWIMTMIVFSLYIGSIQYLLGTVLDPLSCSTYYLLSVLLTFIMTSCVHWFAIGASGAVYIMIFRIVQKSGQIHKKFEKERGAASKKAKKIREGRQQRWYQHRH